MERVAQHHDGRRQEGQVEKRPQQARMRCVKVSSPLSPAPTPGSGVEDL